MKTDKISQQPENCENRNDPDLVQAFLKKWRVKSDGLFVCMFVCWFVCLSGFFLVGR